MHIYRDPPKECTNCRKYITDQDLHGYEVPHIDLSLWCEDCAVWETIPIEEPDDFHE